MIFETLPESDHPAVAVRPIVLDDLPDWLDYLSLPEVYEHTSWNGPTLDSLASHVWRHDMPAPADLLRLAIVLRASDRLVGTIGFHTVSPEHRSAELAYDLSPQVWGQGIASHLVRLMLNWAHTCAGVIRVQATVLESNARSIRVLERTGFEREGLLRSYRLIRGEPGNFHMYAHVYRPPSALRLPSTAT